MFLLARKILFATGVSITIVYAHVTAATEVPTSQEACLLEAIRNAPGDTTVDELRAACEQNTQSIQSTQTGVVDERLRAEKQTEDRPWVITPHRPNYILPISYNWDVNRAPFDEALGEGQALESAEVKFQISFKFPLAHQLFNDRGSLYFAYTNTSWWQLYNADVSSPFRETNHEPEIFLRFENNWEVFGLRNSLIDIGYNHQSNGRSEPLSRSWNRIFATFVFERGNFAFGIRPWVVVGNIDSNDDIEDFLGHGDIRLAYVWKRNTFTALLRNNLSTSDNHGAVELTWSRPLWAQLRLYTQYYYGYGESLIDYNAKVNRLGVGFAINDYLQ